MECLHEQIKSVNCVKICLKCGATLPADFIPGKVPEAAETPVESVKSAKKTATRKKVTK